MALLKLHFLAFLVLFAFQDFVIVQAEEGQCVMYGQCGEGDYGSLNCVYNGPPKIMNDVEGISILKHMCPEYVDGDKALTCCDFQQIESMDANFKLPQRLIGRCPSCFANFRRNFCRLTCSPRQSHYLKVVGTTKSDEGKDMVTDLLYYMSDSFANGLFNSCRNVEGIIPGTRVIDMMCGSWGPKCNGERWLKFMGSTPDNQGFSPVQINYNITTETEVKDGESTYYPMNAESHMCNSSPSKSESICECSDCPEACFKPSTTVPSTTKPSSESSSASSGDLTTKNSIRKESKADDSSLKRNKPEDLSSGASETLPKLVNGKLFRRILSPLIVIAPAFAD